MKALQAGVPSALVVLPHANHYLFISNEADVLREMRASLASLNQRCHSKEHDEERTTRKWIGRDIRVGRVLLLCRAELPDV